MSQLHKQRTVFHIFLIIICIFFSISCKSKKPPKNIIPIEKMALIMADIHLVESMMFNYDYQYGFYNRIAVTDYYHDIYEKHHINDSIFQESFSYYTLHMKHMKKVYELTIKELSKKE